MTKQQQQQQLPSVLVPKPVHPFPPRTHGLIGVPYVQQHMMVDDRWTASSLTEQFKFMANLLAKRQVFLELESKASRQAVRREYLDMKRQCRDGRHKLQMSLHGENQKRIHSLLMNHMDMQRLYQNMPIHMVADNINQRTFVMRKERDKMRHRLNQLKNVYEAKLMQSADLENRIKYQNEFQLEEEVKSREFLKKIQNSYIRLKAFTTINTTYLKMVQVLRHDEIFYEPILCSLNKDVEDQAAFIKHILYIGRPVIFKFKELSEEYRLLEDKIRKSMQGALQMLASYKRNDKSNSPAAEQQPSLRALGTVEMGKRYVRETESMRGLALLLEGIEDIMKSVKFATLCYQVREVYPRMKSQVENNEKLRKMIENDNLGHQQLDVKEKHAEMKHRMLMHNLSEEEIKRLETIKNLKEEIARQDEFEAKTLLHMKNRGDAFVLLRCSLWNLNDILRHVDRPPRRAHVEYPNSYLKLPLLKFDTFTMRAVAPSAYEEDVVPIMHLVHRRVSTLMKHFRKDTSSQVIENCREEYHKEFLDSDKSEETPEVDEPKKKKVDEEEELENKLLQKIPDNTAIKALSRRLVEEFSKKEE